ncbi:uncharacterized protein LOC136076615 [Hydra vulgaris]|uniref:Uncharacterized protein LOC136076615 n=1 Tax=Hydra vulgaris TaxID=6087 RepID=A0ABM4BAR1_HYDVU
METSMKKHSEYEKRIICVLSSLEKSTQDLSNAVLQLNKPRDISSLTHHIPKLTKSLTSNSNQYSDLLNDSVELENTCDFNVTQSFHSSFQKWKAPSTSYGSSGATSHTLNSSDMSDQLNHSFSITNSNAFNDSLVSKSNLTETPVCISIPIWKEPNYPDGSSRKQLVPGHKIYIDHVKFSKCNKSHGTNRFVNDLLVSLVGSTDYLRSVCFSGKQSNAHSDKVAKPKICQDLVDGVVACACQILGVSSKDVRTAIKIKLNIASKVKKR